MGWLGIGVGVTDIPVYQHSGGGTPTPTPTMTSSNSFAQDEDIVMAKTVTFSGAVSPTIGGDDAGQVELIGTRPGTSFTLRWLGDTTQDYTTVNDFNTDHIYTFTLTWTGGTATINVTLNQVIPTAVNAFDASTKNPNITLSGSNSRASFAAFQGNQMVRVDKGLAHTATAYFEMTVNTQFTEAVSALYAGVLLASATNTQRPGRDVGTGCDFASFGWETWNEASNTDNYYSGVPGSGGGSNGDVWRFEMSGGNLVCKLNGVQKGPAMALTPGTVYPAAASNSTGSQVGDISYNGTGWV